MTSGLVEAIKAKQNHSVLPVKFVAIDGHGGSGKSTLAANLARLLGAEIVHTDDFASWTDPVDWWPKLEAAVFAPIRQGAKTLSYDRTSWWEDRHPAPVQDQRVTPIMIVEGVSSARREFRPYLTYSVWVDTPEELRLRRGLDRDGEAALPLWREWIASENAYIQRDDPLAYVDVVMSGTAAEPTGGAATSK